MHTVWYNMHPEETTIHQRNVSLSLFPLWSSRLIFLIRLIFIHNVLDDYEKYKNSMDTNLPHNFYIFTYSLIFNTFHQSQGGELRYKNPFYTSMSVCLLFFFIHFVCAFGAGWNLIRKLRIEFKKYWSVVAYFFLPLSQKSKRLLYICVCGKAIFLMDASSHIWWPLVKYDHTKNRVCNYVFVFGKNVKAKKKKRRKIWLGKKIPQNNYSNEAN